jgi:hypothetical protein
MPSVKKQRKPFVANLQSGVSSEIYEKVLNKITNRDQEDQKDQIRSDQNEKPYSKSTTSDQEDRIRSDQNKPDSASTRPIVSLANSQLSQDSLANNELSQSLAKPTIGLVHSYRTPNYLDDEIMPTLQPSEQLVLRRLYRLSYGFNRDTTNNVSLAKIAEKCNLGIATVKLAIKSLQAKRLIAIQSDLSRNPLGGNKYQVVLLEQNSNLANSELSQSLAKPIVSYIKDDDDLKSTDHHQRGVMMIYQHSTGNDWTKADQAAYAKIRGVPLEKIETAIQVASQRASSRPNSLNYFVKEILNSSQPSKQSKVQQKKALEKIVQQVKASHVGAANYSFSDFVEDVKRACARESVIFNNDLFNELIEKK